MIRVTLVTELEFTGTEAERKHPLIDKNHRYVALIDGKYWSGYMRPVWYGWHFASQRISGHQFDPPGTNGCRWQRVWRVDHSAGLRDPEAILLAAGLDPVEIAAADELRYAETRRRWCIDNHMRDNGQQITEESPIEAWLYKPTAPAMPPLPDDEAEFEDD